MPSNSSSRKLGISPDERRRSFGYAYANGGIWGIASGLASTTLVTYLLNKEYHASGLAISWILAAPALAGMLRLLTPMWLNKVQSRRRFCIGMFLASAVVILALPIISALDVLPTPGDSIFALATTWAGYHVLEYIGAVALWSWFGDLAPRRIRGRFLGRRQAWTNTGKLFGTLIAAAGTYFWHNHCEAIERPELEWQSYASCGLAGAVFFFLSAWPLAFMTDIAQRKPENGLHRDTLRHQLLGPLADRKFRRLMIFGIWFSFSNGIVQSAQWLFQMNVLNLSFVEKKGLDSGSRGIQAMLMPSVGEWVDRHGNVTVLYLSQSIIALAPLFFLVASAESRWLILGAYFCWLAYAGENVAQPNLMLGLSPPGETAACASAWFTWTQLSFSISILFGGWLLDWLRNNFEATTLSWLKIDHFAILFIASWIFKSFGAYLAARIRE